MNRRNFLTGTAFCIAGFSLIGSVGAKGLVSSNSGFPYKMSDEEWQKKLSPQQYAVLRKHKTESAFSSPLNDEKRTGIFHCAGCDHKLFSSKHKFDSGTGWPSFWQFLADNSVGVSEDRKLFYTRTEVHCANCGSHLGHVFEDGPKPTGLRYCINGVAMSFVPDYVH